MKKADRTKMFITEKTSPLFNRKGFAGTSLTDMTEATGLTKGSIYGNFADKEAVALAAFDYHMEQLIAHVRQLQVSARSAEGKLRAFIDVYRHGLSTAVLSDGCPIINLGIEADDTQRQLAEKVNAALSRWRKSISAIIQQGKMQGEFRAETNPSDFASLMIAMIEGGFTMSKISGDSGYLQQSLLFLDQQIQVILTKPSGAER